MTPATSNAKGVLRPEWVRIHIEPLALAARASEGHLRATRAVLAKVLAAGPPGAGGTGQEGELVANPGWLKTLSDDEFEVLRLKAEGWTIGETAVAMGISPAWVKHLQHQVYDKMGILDVARPGTHAAFLYGKAVARGGRRG